MPEVSFFFDYRSPYAYLAHTRLRRRGIAISYHPFDVRDLMKLVGNVPTSVVCKAKNEYVQNDLRRWAAHCGVPLQRHPHILAIDFRRLLRTTILFQKNQFAENLVSNLFDAIWAVPQQLATRSDYLALFRRAGVNEKDLEDQMDHQRWDDELDQVTKAAAQRGVFGAPCMFVGNELFFGNDRIEFVTAAVERGV